MSNALSPAKLANLSIFRLRDMKRSEFTDFLKLVEEREPVLREALAAANGTVNEGILDCVSYAETAISHPHLRPPV